MTDLAIVVVTYNSVADIGDCLRSVACTGAEVVVVDNASTDGTQEAVLQLGGARLLECPRNLGFAGAVNLGIRATTADRVLLLNPDAVIVGSLEGMVRACKEPGVAAVGGKLVDGEGRIQRGFLIRRFPTGWALSFEVLGLNRMWPSNPVNRRYRCLDFDCEHAADVEQPAGAFLMIRREVWRSVGGFDEGFWPVWFEDVDFCRRAAPARSELRIRFEPSAVARHQGGRSVGALAWESRQLYWYPNLLRYASRHLSAGAFRGVCLALIIGSAGRMLVEAFNKRSHRPFPVFGKILRLAGFSLWKGRTKEVRSSPIFVQQT